MEALAYFFGRTWLRDGPMKEEKENSIVVFDNMIQNIHEMLNFREIFESRSEFSNNVMYEMLNSDIKRRITIVFKE